MAKKGVFWCDHIWSDTQSQRVWRITKTLSYPQGTDIASIGNENYEAWKAAQIAEYGADKITIHEREVD